MSMKLNVLIPDGDSTWAMAVIHCLSGFEDYSLFVLSNSKRTPAKYSKYISSYKYHERGSDKSWLDVLKKDIQLHQIDVVIPIAEREIAFFIEHKSVLSELTKIIPLPQLSAFQIASNKSRLSDFCSEQQLPHPKSVLSHSDHINTINNSNIKFPILIKPLDMKGGDGIIKMDSLNDFVNKYNNIEDSIFIQGYISGYDIDCSVICGNGKILCHTIQRGNLKGHNDFAPQLGFDLYEDPQVLKVVEEVMLKLNWSGIAHLDLRYDEQLKRFCIIEINPRFWGSIGASLNAGVNFPDLCIQLALDKDIDRMIFESGHYMRLKGVIKTLKKRPGFIFKRKYLLDHSEVRSFIKDPLPTMYRFIEWLGRKIN